MRSAFSLALAVEFCLSAAPSVSQNASSSTPATPQGSPTYILRPLGWILVAVFALSPSLLGQSKVPNYLSEVERARNESIKADSVSIQRIELGQAHPGSNRFSALATNQTDDMVIVGLDLRADGGVLVQKHQEQFVFLIYPHEQKKLEAEYEFPHLWPEATLRVRFAFPEVAKNGVTDFKDYFFDKSYSVGAGNNAVDFDPVAKFQKRDTQHFQFSFFPDSLASKRLDSIVEEREMGFQKISATLGVAYSRPIRIFFFPDEASKKNVTGHSGTGWAFDNNIVEVYNEKIKLDPYHELTHIIAGQLGDPPAAFDEGLAVYMSESLGADALKYLGSPGKTVDEATVAARSQGKIIPLETLITFADIGPEESNPQVSYPEAASLVKFLISSYGLEKFRLAYSSLKNAADPQGVEDNRQTLKRIYGASPQEIERAWLTSLARNRK
jgi:hypothetical protein